MGLDDEPRYSGILSSTNVPDQVDFFDRKMFELRGVTVDAKETNITDERRERRDRKAARQS